MSPNFGIKESDLRAILGGGGAKDGTLRLSEAPSAAKYLQNHARGHGREGHQP